MFFFSEMNIFHHLKLEFASTIPVSSDETNRDNQFNFGPERDKYFIDTKNSLQRLICHRNDRYIIM